MAWTPSELLSLNLLLEFLDRAVNFLVLLEVGVELFKHLVNVLVNPVTILQLNDQVKSIDLGKMVLAVWNVFQVVEKHKHDPGNLLLAMVVHHLCDFFDNSHCVVLEVLVREIVVTEDPEHAKNIVADLMRCEALRVQQIGDHSERLFGSELLCQIVGLQNSHKCESVSIN